MLCMKMCVNSKLTSVGRPGIEVWGKGWDLGDLDADSYLCLCACLREKFSGGSDVRGSGFPFLFSSTFHTLRSHLSIHKQGLLNSFFEGNISF
jgi:hypothetical protein